MLYNFSLTIAYKDAMSLFPNFQKLPKDVKKVLVDMSFNMGINKLSGFKDMRQAVIEGDFNTAADEMIDSIWYVMLSYIIRSLTFTPERYRILKPLRSSFTNAGSLNRSSLFKGNTCARTLEDISAHAWVSPPTLSCPVVARWSLIT